MAQGLAHSVFVAATINVRTITDTPNNPPAPAAPDFTIRNTGRTAMATKTMLSQMHIS